MAPLWAYAQIHVISTNVTGLSPWDFLTAGTRFNTSIAASGASHEAITFKEIIAGSQMSGASVTTGKTAPFEQMGMNLQANFLPLVFTMISLGASKKILQRLGLNRSLNRLSDSLGTGSMIRA